jgi:uncharacterized protein YkwD
MANRCGAVRWLVVAALGLAPAGPGCTAGPAVGPPGPTASRPLESADVESILAGLVAAHNAERERKGLPPLALDPRLEAAARVHAADMASRDRLSHRGADRSSPFRRLEDQGYRFRAAAENIACGDFTLERLMRGWKTSPGHRRNILGPYDQIGAAGAVAPSGRTYWCVTFGKAFEP